MPATTTAVLDVGKGFRVFIIADGSGQPRYCRNRVWVRLPSAVALSFVVEVGDIARIEQVGVVVAHVLAVLAAGFVWLA